MKKGVYTLKNFPAARAKSSNLNEGLAGGRCVRKWRFSKKKTASAGGTIFSEALILYSDIGGTMQQKMSIFKEGNSVCRVQKFQVEF